MGSLAEVVDLLYYFLLSIITRVYQQLQSIVSRQIADKEGNDRSPNNAKGQGKEVVKIIGPRSKIPDLIQDDAAAEHLREMNRRKACSEKSQEDDGIECVGLDDVDEPSPAFLPAPDGKSPYPENWVVYDKYLGLILKTELDKIRAKSDQQLHQVIDSDSVIRTSKNDKSVISVDQQKSSFKQAEPECYNDNDFVNHVRAQDQQVIETCPSQG